MKEITLNDLHLRQIFKSAKKVLDPKVTRPILREIYCEVEGGAITATACNGYAMNSTTIELPMPSNEGVEPFTFFLQPIDVPKGDYEVVINGEDESRLEITLKNGKNVIGYKLPQPEGNYMDYRKIFPQTSAALAIRVDARLLIRTLQSFVGIADKNEVVLSFAPDGYGLDSTAPILISTAKTCVSSKGVVLPLRRLK